MDKTRYTFDEEFQAEVDRSSALGTMSRLLSWFAGDVQDLSREQAAVYLCALSNRSNPRPIEGAMKNLDMDTESLAVAVDLLVWRGLVRLVSHDDGTERLDITDAALRDTMDKYAFSRFATSIDITTKTPTMKYHNHQTIAEDLRGNNHFRFQRFLGQSNLADNMKRVIDTTVGRNSRDTKAFDAVKQAFDCEDAEAELVSMLAQLDGYVSSPARLAALVGQPVTKVEAGLQHLFENGMINQPGGTDAIILTQVASMCIGESCSLAEVSDRGIISILMMEGKDVSFRTSSFSTFMRFGPSGRIVSFIRENRLENLPDAEQLLFWGLCRCYLLHFTAPYGDEFSSKAMSELIKRGWVETFATVGDSSELTKKDNYCLSASVAGCLFMGRDNLIDYSILSSLATFKHGGEIEGKTLFFCDSDLPAIEKLERIAGEEEFQRISKGLAERNLKVAVSAILYGVPGTGKTELVRQIARKTGRNLLLVDASKLHGSYWGEDERNIRDLFRLFRHVSALSQLAPILFIDEAEGLLGKRVADASSRADRSSNIVQNILLEELNDFRGLLFVTTNDVKNLDPAMDRRFLMKIEFHVPDEKVRARIWHSMMPSLDDAVVAHIAREYSFSGGHIENVARKASIDEILDDIRIDAEALSTYCSQEDGFSAVTKMRKIGF